MANSLTTVQKDSMVMDISEVRIRKLTPKECWRLMAFSREEDGKWDDTAFEAAEKVNSNTQLYTQAGNSICVNVLEAIFGQLFTDHEGDYIKRWG